MKLFFALVFAFNMASTVLAGTIQINEELSSSLKGTGEAVFEQVKADLKKKCDAWKVSSQFMLTRATEVLNKSCAVPSFSPMEERVAYTHCYYQTHPVTGEQIEYCDRRHKTVQVGYKGKLLGSLVLNVPVDAQSLQVELSGESFAGSDSAAKAWNSYFQECKKWLEEKKSIFGEKLVFAGCRGTSTDTLTKATEGDISTYASKAELIFQ